MTRWRTALLSALLATVATHPGCECQDPELVELQASAELPADTLDFGEVPVGARRTLSRPLRNPGTASLEILAVELVPADGAFFVEVVPSPVPAQGSAELRATFRPSREGSAEATLRLRTNARENPPALGLRGQGVRPAVEVEPTSLDFGAAGLGERVPRAVRLRNLRGVDQQVWLTLQDNGAVHFAVDGGGGRRTVPASSDVIVELVYAPRHGGLHGAQLRVDSCGEGCGVRVTLHGRCEVPRIVVDPLRLDFGVLPPGQSAQGSVRLRNAGYGPLHVDAVRVVLGAPVFALARAFDPVDIGEGQEIALQVDFAPVQSGLAEGRLEIGSDDPAAPVGHVELAGQRQGAELVAVPARLEFGVVREPGPHLRHLILVNRGDQPARVLDGQVQGEAFASSLLPVWPLDVDGGGSAVIELSYAPTATGTSFGRLLLQTDVPETPLLEVALAGTRAEAGCVLVPSVDSLRFGSVLVGSSSWQLLTLDNQGNQACAIAGVGFSPLHVNDPAFSVEPPSTSLVDPGAQATVRAVFAPTQGGLAKAAVQVQLADAALLPALVGLQGSGARAGVSAAPPVLDFGTTVASCGSVQRAVVVANIGQVAVELGYARIEGAAASAFVIDQGAWIGGLAPGWSHLIQVSFTPGTAGLHHGLLVVDGGAAVAGVVVPLTGQALATGNALVSEHFEIPSLNQVDVLFVVDNSGSMGDNQDNLASNFDHFIRYADFVGQAIDYQIAVVTTDVQNPQQAGRLVSTPRILRRSTPNLTQRFAESVRVGIQGSGWEQGLEATFLALSPPLVDDPVYNQGFLRADAALQVVVVSDEDDGSPQPLDAYVGFLRGLKAARGLPAQFHAVTGGYTGCERDGVWAHPAPRYDEAVRQTGGRWADLCAPDWGGQIEDLGAAVFLARGRLHLQGYPDPGSLQVYVDGELLDPNLWTYDPLSRAVTLAPQALPPAGTDVDVTYVMGC